MLTFSPVLFLKNKKKHKPTRNSRSSRKFNSKLTVVFNCLFINYFKIVWKPYRFDVVDDYLFKKYFIPF